MAAEPLPSLREALQQQGLWADKALGQHFLLDLNITRKIVRTAPALAGKAVIEVGPGPGGLTRALLEAGADPVIAIEKDPRFLPVLEPLIAWSDGRLRLICADALDADEPALLREAGASEALILANLPYNVATPLIIKWLKAPTPWRGPMRLMVQKEVGERIAARPGSDGYGRLSVIAQAACAASIAMAVPAQAFVPPPKVDSVIVALDPLASPFDDLPTLERVTAAAFGQRRKMLRSSLASLGGERLLATAGVAPTARAEEIDIAGFLRLARALRG